MKLRARIWIGFGLLCVALVAATPDAEELVRRLGDPRAQQRDDAARGLLAMGDAAAPALETAVSDAEPEVRARARALLQLVTEGDGAGSAARVRAAEVAVSDALHARGGFDEGSPADARIAALMPESGRALAAAARRIAARELLPRPFACALVRHATPESFEALAECVRDERLAASAGLACARCLDAALADAETAASLRREAQASLPALLDAMSSPLAPTRRIAVALYGALAGGDGAARIAESAGDIDAGVRAEVCRVLGVHAAAESATTLRQLASDAAPDVRAAALAALMNVPGSPHPEPAVAAAFDASPAVRAAAARLLAREATPDTRGVLDALASDPSARVRAAARGALAALRD